jgi:hypothetical protein
MRVALASHLQLSAYTGIVRSVWERPVGPLQEKRAEGEIKRLQSGGKRNLKAFCFLSGQVGSRGYKTLPGEGVAPRCDSGGRHGKGSERRQVTALSRGNSRSI